MELIEAAKAEPGAIVFGGSQSKDTDETLVALIEVGADGVVRQVRGPRNGTRFTGYLLDIVQFCTAAGFKVGMGIEVKLADLMPDRGDQAWFYAQITKPVSFTYLNRRASPALVEAVNAIGASPADLVAILEALKQAGALKAELIVL